MSFSHGYYIEIAKLLNDIIPVKWKVVHLCAELDGDTVESYFYYLNEDNEYIQATLLGANHNITEPQLMSFAAQLSHLVIELNEKYVENGHDKWTIITYTLGGDLKYKVDYSYENLNDSTIEERKELWQEKYLVVKAK